MKLQERENLATAYANAWYAVKGRTVEVNAGPRGWYTIRYEGGGIARGVRSGVLLEGLVTLTNRLMQNDVVKWRTQ